MGGASEEHLTIDLPRSASHGLDVTGASEARRPERPRILPARGRSSAAGPANRHRRQPSPGIGLLWEGDGQDRQIVFDCDVALLGCIIVQARTIQGVD